MTPATPPQADATPKVQLRRGAKTKTKAKPTGKTQARGKAKAPPGDKVKAKRQRAAKPKQQAKRTRKQATARHTRAIQRDRSKRPLVAPPPAQMQERLKELLHPATLAQVAHFHGLGLRQRLLTLPVMVAVVLSLLWRQIGGARDLTRTLKREGFLWCSPVQVSPQALSERLRTLPAGLFLRILEAILPAMQARFAARTRPLPPVVAWARERYAAVLVADGSTLDALLRKVGLLQDAATHPLAGRMLALLDLASQLPRQIWYCSLAVLAYGLGRASGSQGERRGFFLVQASLG